MFKKTPETFFNCRDFEYIFWPLKLGRGARGVLKSTWFINHHDIEADTFATPAYTTTKWWCRD